MARPHDSYHHGDLRAALIEAGLALLDAEGPDGVTVRGVARKAGVSHAAPANHFAGRRQLLTALAIAMVANLRRDLERSLRTAGPVPRARLQAFADTFVGFGLSWPQRHRLLWRHDMVDSRDPTLRTALDALYEDLKRELDALGARKPYDRDTAAIAFWSLVHGYVSLRIEGTFTPRRDTLTGETRERAIVGALLAGLATGPSGRRRSGRA